MPQTGGNCELQKSEVSFFVHAADLDSIPTKRIRPEGVAIRTEEQLPEMASRGLGLVPETTHRRTCKGYHRRFKDSLVPQQRIALRDTPLDWGMPPPPSTWPV